MIDCVVYLMILGAALIGGVIYRGTKQYDTRSPLRVQEDILKLDPENSQADMAKMPPLLKEYVEAVEERKAKGETVLDWMWD